MVIQSRFVHLLALRLPYSVYVQLEGLKASDMRPRKEGFVNRHLGSQCSGNGGELHQWPEEEIKIRHDNIVSHQTPWTYFFVLL
jgi:hypothetical protein